MFLYCCDLSGLLIKLWTIAGGKFIAYPDVYNGNLLVVGPKAYPARISARPVNDNSDLKVDAMGRTTH